MNRVFVLLICFFLAGCVAGEQELPGIPEASEVAAAYRNLTLITLETRYMADPGLCRLPIPGTDRPVHALSPAAMKIYVNETAVAAMANPRDRIFPRGSVIVKEKLDPFASPADAEVLGLGIMIKREEGYNPEGDDWQYAYWEEGKLTQNQSALAHCQACHHDGEIGDIPENLKEQWFLVEGNLLYLTLMNEARDSIFFTASASNSESADE